ncbi:ubiquinone biosynthesis protein coq-8 [Lineolata rhizophorae]|uniref:Ubiquinone biosynthesis protein coq-8 n=1 Tax=Lineolata rhizophorae TaxID=578093 RepID=A0A6A6P1B4_9PEZI|nr:ubiquinone biosynthesis protein coq-8 [Lineolata rhizophorae]
MSGRRLIDAAKVLRASQTIAKQHVALRSQQLDVFTKTSSLARAAKSQADRVTVTARAAIALAERLRETAPPPPPGFSSDHSKHEQTGDKAKEKAFEDRQDVSRERSGADFGTTQELKGSSQEAQQSTAAEEPAIERGPSPLAEAGTENIVDERERAKDGTRGPTDPEKYAPRHDKLAEATLQEEEMDVPEGANLDVFRTRRVSRMLRDQGFRQNPTPNPYIPKSEEPARSKVTSAAENVAEETAPQVDTTPEVVAAPQVDDAQVRTHENAPTPFQLRQSRVPSSRVGRIWQYGGLATSMAWGMMGEGLRRVTGSGSDAGSLLLSASNTERLVAKLSKMRGAALKLGQMMSFQDVKMLPTPIHEVLRRVQDSADYMPPSQRDSVLAKNLGCDWRDLFSEFEEVPIAAASIGQVHRAILRSDDSQVAVKVQYPGVARSIDSDLNNLSLLLTASRLLPKGLFLDRTIANARTELAWECDYVREAEGARRFKEFLADETDTFTVPAIIPEASAREVLTAEYMAGTAVTKIPHLTQEQRDWIGTQILRLCLREITEFHFMQSDPNWTNFLYNAQTEKLELLDFGASREYSDDFIDRYICVLEAASRGDRKTVRDISLELGYLTGHESTMMLDAHVDSVLTLAEPFCVGAPEVYDFRDQTITDRVRGLIPTMIKERLAPPPEETYSLHRKLSGAFLLCANLGSRVRCKELFEKAILRLDVKA